MKKHARALYYWPSMSKDIEDTVDRCEPCQTTRQSTDTEKPAQLPRADAPMDSISLDLFDFAGSTYLVMVDRFSGWYDVVKLNKLDTAAVLKALGRWTSTYGLPLTIMTDGGPQFRSAFSSWCDDRQIAHVTSSPYHPQSNGLAEAAVKQAKLLMERVNGNNDDFHDHLQVARNTPRTEGPSSPSQLFIGRRQRVAGLPAANERPPNAEAISPRASTFNVGDRVRVQDTNTKRWATKATITEVRASGSSFMLIADDGSSMMRNVRFLRHLTVSAPSSIPDVGDEDDENEDEDAAPRRSHRTRGLTHFYVACWQGFARS